MKWFESQYFYDDEELLDALTGRLKSQVAKFFEKGIIAMKDA